MVKFVLYVVEETPILASDVEKSGLTEDTGAGQDDGTEQKDDVIADAVVSKEVVGNELAAEGEQALPDPSTATTEGESAPLAQTENTASSDDASDGPADHAEGEAGAHEEAVPVEE